MLGAAVGDIVGAPYEFDYHAIKTTEFPLFGPGSSWTDDTVMTVAVAEALLTWPATEAAGEAAVATAMQHWGRRYPGAGYGDRFAGWLWQDDPGPYGSYGNGSAMRVSAAGWLYTTLDETERWAAVTARSTHDHPEGIKGAQATAAAIFLARTGTTKAAIKAYVETRYEYDLDRTIAQIRPTYHHVESCQRTVPEAIIAFLESTDFETAIRLAVSLGGDADTLAAITGSIAEAAYGIPAGIRAEARARLDPTLLYVLDKIPTPGPPGSRLESMIDDGRLTLPTQPLDEALATLRTVDLPPGSPSLSDTLLAMREEERP